MDDDDFAKPQIGVASSWNEITPCNLSLDRLAKAVKEGVFAAGGYPLEFGTISVSDGISMGHEGMHFSLVSREVIADSVETVMQAERLDGSVLLAGCDKSLPGMLMAAARLDLAAVFLYAGTILPGSRQAVRRHRARGDDHRRVRGGRRVRPRPDTARGRRRHRASHLPRRGCLRRHVHRQYHGQRRRGDGHVAARQRGTAGDRPSPRRVRAPQRGSRRRAAAARHHRPRHPHQGGVRERDRGGDGVRRLDQRGTAPVGHRLRGQRQAVAGGLQPHRRHACRTLPTSSRSANT